MLKKSITYTDFNGDQQTDDFYFHLSKADLVEMEVSHNGGMAEFLQKIAASNDGKAIITEFKNLILSSYGQKSDDGKRFIKSAALREEFQSSEAYSALFFELCTDANAAAAFVNGVVPGNLAEEMAAVTRAETPQKASEAPKPLHNESMAVREPDPGVVGVPDVPTPVEQEFQTRRNVFENDRFGEPAETSAPRVLTHQEAIAMDADELRSGLATGRYTFR